MVKAELLTRVAALNDNLPDGTCRLVVDAFFGALTKQLENGGRIELRGFGTLFVVINEQVDRRNPRTGAAVTVARSCRVRFRAANQVMKLLNPDN